MHSTSHAALSAENQRLAKRLAREREVRLRAEVIAERGLRDLYEKQRQLAFLADIATIANRSVSVAAMLGAALPEICVFTGCAAAHAYLLTGRPGDHGRLCPSNIWHVATSRDLSLFQQATTQRFFRKGEGLPGVVWAGAAPAWIADLSRSDNFPRFEAAWACGLRAAFAIPLLIEAEVVGVLEFFTEAVMDEDAGLLAVMGQAASHLGRVIEREYANDRLHDALRDALTSLPNRASFLRQLDQALRDYKLDGTSAFALLFIDLDQFKIVNDSLGHGAGDNLIVQVGARLRSSVRGSDLAARPGEAAAPERDPDAGAASVLARLGGDEFTVLLRGVGAAADALAVANRIHEALRVPFDVDGREMVTTASIGVVLGHTDYASADEVLRDAGLAMYSAKTRGKARSELYDAAMHASALARMSLEGDLRAALRDNAFLLHYQPIVRLSTREIVGFEALVRWQTAAGTLRSPGDFIPVAEETGLIVPLGLWVLREACLTSVRWNHAFQATPPRTISVNLSARQFVQPDLVERVRAIVAETRIDPTTLRLEITETAMMDDANRAIATLSALRGLGIRISIDDFGTGYSSLSYLHRFPIQVLKIDRSFVSRMESSTESLQIVRTIMSLARNLGMEVIAEGAERKPEIDRLTALGCDYCQGYYFSRPVPEAAAEALMRDHRPEAASDPSIDCLAGAPS